MGEGISLGEESYDRAAKVEEFLVWLARWGLSAIPTRMLPPIDASQLQVARQRAIQTAIETNRISELRSYRSRIIDWALEVYRRHGLNPVYFTGYWSSAKERSQAIDVLIDEMMARLLWDVLPDEVTTVLITQFDVLHGGSLFGAPDVAGND